MTGKLDETTTTVTFLLDDQGGGGLMCDVCNYYEDHAYWVDKCPNCLRIIVDTSTYVPLGGSDF